LVSFNLDPDFMRFQSTLFLLLATLIMSWPSAANGQRLEPEALFLGNSYTYVNNLPAIIRGLAVAGGDTLIHDQNTPGGYTLNGHSTNATSINKINGRNWDFVILQEQSQLPSFSPGQVANQSLPYAALLDSIVQANDSCTETVFYMTWGRKYGDQSNCGNYPPVCTYAGMQTRLRASYLLMTQNNNATVAPCGVAWWETILRDSTIELYSPDESHPSYAGSYLNACVFYATIYRKSPLGLNYYGSLDTNTAILLQEVARDVVFDSLEQWRIGHADAIAAFDYTLSPTGQVQFSDSSQQANWWMWDFGDGGIDSVASPAHQYNQSGQYFVQLIVGNGCTTDTLMDTVDVLIVGMKEADFAGISISPNPSGGTFQLKIEQNNSEVLKVKAYDIRGAQVYSRQFEANGNSFSIEINLGNPAAGLYLLEIEMGNQRVTRRIWIRD
jgi:hypothetical protein